MIPVEELEVGTTMLSFCIVNIHLKEESNAIKNLAAIVTPKDGSPPHERACEMLPLIIKEAQGAQMMRLHIAALSALAKLIEAREGGAKDDLPVIIRTAISLQLAAASQMGGLDPDSCVSFCSVVEQGIEALDKATQQDPGNHMTADIATWIFKTTYNVANDDNNTIDPATRLGLCNHALELFGVRTSFEKPVDDESYHVALWATLHILTAKVTQAKLIEGTPEPEYGLAWAEVTKWAQHSLNYLSDAMQHNREGLASFQGTDTAVEVILLDAMVKLKVWDDIASMMDGRKATMSFEALEAIADLVCKESDSPSELKIKLIFEVIDGLWDPVTGSTNKVAKFSSWTQRMLQIRLAGSSTDDIKELERYFNSVRSALTQNEAMRRQWPRDSLQWMSTASVSGIV
jgi:hypothetical protein